MENKIFSFLSPVYAEEARRAYRASRATLTEVRLRAGHLASLTLRDEKASYNLPLSFSLSEEEMREVFTRVCGGSIHAYEESIKEGYLSLDKGVRVGICGRAVRKEGVTRGITAIKSLCFRIPHRCIGAADILLSVFEKNRCGILLFSPPGVGKTTLLREFAREISRGKTPKRCAVIDTRGEFFGFERECLIDLLTGYPKAEGAEIAVRTLSPEVLLMDEIGKKESSSLLSLASLGVPVIASVHGESEGEVCASSVRTAIEQGIFPLLFDVKRNTAIHPSLIP